MAKTPAKKVQVYVGAVEGKGLISSIIRWFQWGKKSTHVFYLRKLESGKYLVTEAWHLPLRKGGIVRSYEVDTPYFLEDEKIQYYTALVTPRQKKRLESFLDHIVKLKSKYDYPGILGFVTRNPRTNDKRRWFCSELLIAAFLKVGIYLFNEVVPQSESPASMLRTPLLKKYTFPTK